MSFAAPRPTAFTPWRSLGLIVSLGVSSWLIGIGVFAVVQRLLPQSQLEVAAFWSAVASLLLLPVAVTPILLEGHQYRPTVHSMIPVVLAALGFLPVTLIGGIWGAGGPAPSPTAIAGTCLMGLVLAAFAAGYAAQSRRR